MDSSCIRLRTSVVFVMLSMWGGLAEAATSYWRVTTDRMSVVSDANARRCERLAMHFIRLEQLVGELSAWESDFELTPMAVFSVSRSDAREHFLTDQDRADFQRQVYSKFLPHERLNIAAIVNTGSEEPLQSALLMYAQRLMMGGPARRSPAWYQLGVSNILNGLVIRDDGSVILNRNVIFEATVDSETRQVKKLDLERLLALDPSKIDQSNIRAYSSLARDWALFGLLTTPERKRAYDELVLLMGQGTPGAEAVEQAFGRSLAVVAQEFESREWRAQVTYKLPPPSTPITVPAAVKLDEEQSKLQLQILEQRIEQTPM